VARYEKGGGAGGRNYGVEKNFLECHCSNRNGKKGQGDIPFFWRTQQGGERRCVTGYRAKPGIRAREVGYEDVMKKNGSKNGAMGGLTKQQLILGARQSLVSQGVKKETGVSRRGLNKVWYFRSGEGLRRKGYYRGK